MDAPAEDRDKRSFHLALCAFVPVVMLPLSWYLAIRARRQSRAASDAEAIVRALWAKRLLALSLIDTAIGAVVAAALLFAPRTSQAPAPLPEPRSPFEPIGGIRCGDVWREQALSAMWPVVLGCAIIAALWWRARLKEPRASGRWGLVLVPLTVAPLCGVGAAYFACSVLGGWSIGVALIGLLAQGLAMLILGGAAMMLAAAELRVVVGPRLSARRAGGVAVLYMVAGLARAALLIGALWALLPALRWGRDTSIEALLAGQSGWLGRALVLTAAVGVAPIAEEVLFRGLLLPGLAQRMSAASALLWSSALFALLHAPSHGLGALAPGVLGLVFGWARLRTGGLAAPILLHAANNLLVTLVTWAGG